MAPFLLARIPGLGLVSHPWPHCPPRLASPVGRRSVTIAQSHRAGTGPVAHPQGACRCASPRIALLALRARDPANVHGPAPSPVAHRNPDLLGARHSPCWTRTLWPSRRRRPPTDDAPVAPWQAMMRSAPCSFRIIEGAWSRADKILSSQQTFPPPAAVRARG